MSISITAKEPTANQDPRKETIIFEAKTKSPASTPRQLDKSVAPTALETVKEESGEMKEEMLSPKYAALARREAQIRRQAKELQAEKEALKAKQAEYESDFIPKSQLRERLQKDPLGFLTEQEVTYDQITNAILNSPRQEDPALIAIQAKLKAIEEAQIQSQKAQNDDKNKAYEQAVAQIRSQAKILIDANEDYSTIQETDSIEAVVELIKETFEAEGTLLTVEDAAKQVEAYLLEEALKMASLKKVKARLTPQEEIEGKNEIESATKQILKPQPMKTLTHTQTPSVSKPMSARERAILAFQGKQQ